MPPTQKIFGSPSGASRAPPDLRFNKYAKNSGHYQRERQPKGPKQTKSYCLVSFPPAHPYWRIKKIKSSNDRLLQPVGTSSLSREGAFSKNNGSQTLISTGT